MYFDAGINLLNVRSNLPKCVTSHNRIIHKSDGFQTPNTTFGKTKLSQDFLDNRPLKLSECPTRAVISENHIQTWYTKYFRNTRGLWPRRVWNLYNSLNLNVWMAFTKLYRSAYTKS